MTDKQLEGILKSHLESKLLTISTVLSAMKEAMRLESIGFQDWSVRSRWRSIDYGDRIRWCNVDPNFEKGTISTDELCNEYLKSTLK